MSPTERASAIRETRESYEGTTWVAPSEGSTWSELIAAFGEMPRGRGQRLYVAGTNTDLRQRTNLLLTGAPIAAYDRQRWESGNVE
mgnify:CR=1 FL=1